LDDKDGLDQWTDDQLKKLNALTKPKTRLLHDEIMGIVELPVLLVRGYITEDGFLELRRNNFEIDRALGSYQVIKNALLMGVKAGEVKTLTQMGETYTTLVDACQDPDLKGRLKAVRPIGPVIRKDGHLYAPLVPVKAFDAFHFEKWTIQPTASSYT